MNHKLIALALAPVVMVAALAATPASAASTQVTVPFSFQVQGKTLPAGTYTVQSGAFGNFVKLSGKDASQTFTWLVNQGDPRADRVTLQFTATGDAHALHAIHYGNLITATLDGKSKSKHGQTEVAQGQ